MNNEELLNRIGNALISAGTALVTGKPANVDTTPIVQPTEEKVEAKPKEAEKKTKKKRKRRTKAQIEADKKAEEEKKDDGDDFEAEVVSEDDFDTGEVETDEPAVDEDKLKSALVAYAKEHGKDKAFGVLAKYKAKKVADLDPKHYKEVYEQVAINA